MKQITGNKLLVKALKEEGVEILFGYPGACTIDISDALYQQDQIRVVLPRHEQALVHEADAYARTTGKVGVCLVTSGPGATNLVTGIATAYSDSVPLVCFTGQVQRYLIGNDAFQEVDIVGITRNISKYGVTVRDRADLGRIIKEAFYIASTGKPGPVLIDLPKDVMAELGDPTYPTTVNIRGYKPSTGVHIGQLKRAAKMLEKAQKPLFLMGGGVAISGAHDEVLELAQKTKIPVATTIMGKGTIPSDHPLYIGNIGMHGSFAANMAVNECDLLFSIGARFNERITGKLHTFAPNAKIVHIDIESSSISKNIRVDVPIVADAKAALQQLVAIATESNTEEWLLKIVEWKLACPLMMTLKRKNGLNPQDVFDYINDRLDEAVITTDVGQHQMWATQFLTLSKQKKLLTSGGLGTMGYGFPAALGAKLGRPDLPVLCITGDGGMQMNSQEFATAVMEEIPVVICVFNNGVLGMVRQWQTLFYGKRYAMTKLTQKGGMHNKDEEVTLTPDFVKLAESYGAHGIRVTCSEEIAPAFEEALRETRVPVLIDFMIDSDDLVVPMLKPGGTLTDMITEG